ncbi:cytidine deaminase-like superfamily protein [Tetraselmis virus 1]|uniref:Cytidine deaminase-like superfamily protein n=1 Tax=Tetraselmis virus 1 TaxID=2060617 RepID=A0A2P0VMI9_9VIRU|nr:cytidine deaminase-like superfamily protein [Tetraselmis virus 1]AUF82103.1 cytidine deaminase-like superfamily protein [Tetraselmis virus 1]
MNSSPKQENVPSWDEYFLNIAKEVSVRSIDPSTKHGCVLVDQDNRIIATGYNGPVSGIPHELIDFTRPNKYTWMCHAEQNALCFARCDLRGATAYITGRPCAPCFRQMLQSGITRIVYGSVNSVCISDYDAKACDMMAQSKGVTMVKYDV